MSLRANIKILCETIVFFSSLLVWSLFVITFTPGIASGLLQIILTVRVCQVDLHIEIIIMLQGGLFQV